MSIYRLSDRCPRSDVHAPAVEETRLALEGRPTASLIKLDAGDYEHLRRAKPANRVFPRTSMWLENLPKDVRPTAVARRYPRIANLIAAVWGNSDFFHTYMESLLNDHRGNRRGFPPDVLDDLMSLERYYGAVNGSKRPSSAAGQRA